MPEWLLLIFVLYILYTHYEKIKNPHRKASD